MLLLASPDSRYDLFLLRNSDTRICLQDGMFQGVYNDKQKHEADWDLVMEVCVCVSLLKAVEQRDQM